MITNVLIENVAGKNIVRDTTMEIIESLQDGTNPALAQVSVGRLGTRSRSLVITLV